MTEIVHRNGDALSGVASLFFDAVKNGQAAPGEDYPYAYVVELGDRTFIGFDTNLPEFREPWSVEGLEFDRDSVIEAVAPNELDIVGGDMKVAVNALIDALV